MTQFTRSVVFVGPAADVGAIQSWSAGLGYVLGLSVPLSSDGEEPATHYGSVSVLTPALEATLAAEENAPPKTLLIDVQDTSAGRGFAHFDAVLSAEGLVAVQGEMP